ncbi:MAG: putative metal-binding motif-containing protein [Kofleriaceae bacterium]
MERMNVCDRCGGLVPPRLDGCPNCGRRGVRAALGGVLGALGGGAVMLTLMACYGRPVHTVCDPADDRDGDGFCPGTRGAALDCNDGDASVHPGAVDDAVDGIDQDCDGRDGPGNVGPAEPAPSAGATP